jgi:hypothetical protein
MSKPASKRELQREEFSDGSALTYADGSMLIIETKLAKQAVMRERTTVKYADVPPVPPYEIQQEF